MPALTPTEFYGTVTYLGHNKERAQGLASDALQTLDATFAGCADESHAGLTRLSCSRVTSQYPRGTEIRNTRQFSVLSQEQLEGIARKMGLETLDPRLLGASIVLAGIPDFTLVPPSSRLQFCDGATLTVDMENRPCVLPAVEIDKYAPGFGKGFKPAAKGLRGVTCWVEREGRITIGDRVRLHVPSQPVWPHLSD
jgi:hypothetical protein